jgi:hypothetical protein
MPSASLISLNIGLLIGTPRFPNRDTSLKHASCRLRIMQTPHLRPISHIDALKLGLAHQFKAYLSEKNREKSIPLRFCPKYQLAGNHSINF